MIEPSADCAAIVPSRQGARTAQLPLNRAPRSSTFAPALILAAEHAAEDPSAVMFMNDRQYWIVVAVRASADRLVAWAERHTVAAECEEVAP